MCCTTLPKDWAPFEKMHQTPVSHVKECQWGWSSSCLRSLLQKIQTWYAHRILVPLIVTLSVGYKIPRTLSTMASKQVRALWPQWAKLLHGPMWSSSSGSKSRMFWYTTIAKRRVVFVMQHVTSLSISGGIAFVPSV